ncbi:MAG TPA: FecR domain-containing protein [Polyangiaceae bacterium]|nr:FecR domain-containing protein [Polyangiaceae bacterium]
MTPAPEREGRETRGLAALTRLGRDAVERPSAAELDKGLNVLLARIAAREAGRTHWVRRSLVAVAALACLVGGIRLSGALYQRWTSHPPALSYRVEGGSVLEGGYLRDSGAGEVRVLFNEGSKVTLMRGARGRLRTVDEQGSRVVIDHGTASFEVARSNEFHWFVEAGPFSVAVKGTQFTVSWDPVTEQFELNLRHGRVVVSGPVLEGDIELRAGRRLVVNLARAETRITDEKPGTVNDPPKLDDPAARTAAPEAVHTPESSTPAPAMSAAVPPPAASSGKLGRGGWSEQLAKGRWNQILDEAERVGLQTTLETASSEDLFALADAARYRRRLDVARAALLAQRRRFPQSARSLDALFLLARVSESHDRARAIEGYDDYLRRSPSGTYAAEALGRKMVLTNELGGRSAAKPIAEEYLRRFPGGSYAGSARALSKP